MLYPILMYHFRCEQELLYYFCQFNIYLYLVISKYKYPVCGCEQEQSRQWPWCHLGEWWQ